MLNKVRCPWSNNNPLMIKYHDEEWGVPLHNDHLVTCFRHKQLKK
jgi:DNA-3-methyladenine glycosylase I